MRYLISAILLCTPLVAQVRVGRATTGVAANPADLPPPVVKPEDKCTVEGTVVSATTGEPLKKARVSLRAIGQHDGIYGATTDGAGHFLIEGVDPGRYNFSASRNTYVSQTYSPQGSKRGSSLTLTNGQKLKEVIFKLTPQGVISGRILDEDGEPMSNVVVQCMAFGYQRGKRQLMGRNGSSTNDLGEFRFHSLSPGKYIISASYRSPDMFMALQGPVQTSAVSEEGYATTFYPNSTRPDSAQQLEITPGAQISGINMTLVKVRTVHVKGRVNGLAVSNRARRNASVMLMPRDSAGFMMMPGGVARILDQQGTFEMRGIAPGSYLLRADFNEENVHYSARMPLEVGNSNIEGIELNLQPPVEVHGHLTIEENGDLKGAQINVSLQAKGSDGPMAMMGGVGSPVKDDLTFKIANVALDPYEINVRGLPDGFYLKSIRMGQVDVTETGVDFSQGVSADEMNVVINPNGGEIDGAVQNAKGEPATGATVTLIPDASHRAIAWLYKTADTDQNGRFSIKGIRPGEYKIYAWEDVEQGAYMDPDFVKPHESAGEAVTVKDNSPSSIQLKAIPAENSTNEKAVR